VRRKPTTVSSLQCIQRLRADNCGVLKSCSFKKRLSLPFSPGPNRLPFETLTPTAPYLIPGLLGKSNLHCLY